MSNDIGANALAGWMKWVLGFIIGGMFALGTFTFRAYAHADTVAREESKAAVEPTQKQLDKFEVDVKALLQTQTILLQQLVIDVAVIKSKMGEE